MRERMEKLVLLPFSVGCVSESSVAVAVQGPRRSKPHSNPSPIRTNNKIVEEDDDESLSGESTKSSLRSLSLPKPNISTGIHRLFKGVKNFSQYFVYKEEMEELEMDMEIGGPTDVKHVTHIGWDGSATNDVDDAIKGWENLISPELLSVPNSMPSNPWRQSFDFMSNINMAKQVQPDHIHPPLVNGSAS